MSNCDDCIFNSVYRDMGASADCCSLVKDLSMSIAEVKFYSLCKCCRYYLSKGDLVDFALNNDKDDVLDVFNYIRLNKGE